MTLNDISIGRRLGLAFTATCLITLATAVLGCLLIRDIEQRFLEIDGADNAKIHLSEQFALRAEEVRHHLDLRLAALPTGDKPPEWSELDALWGRLQAAPMDDDEERQLRAALQAQWLAFRAAGLEVQGLLDAGRIDEARDAALARLAPAHRAMKARIGECSVRQARHKQALTDAIVESYEMAVLVLSVFAAVSILVSALAGWRISRSIVEPIRMARDCALKLARGDLTGSVACQQVDRGRDEAMQLLSAMRTMHQGLRDMVAMVQNKAGSVAAAAGQISAGSMDLSSRTESQASSLQQTASTMGQLTSTVQTTAESGAQAAELAGGALSVASRGGEITQRVVRSMTEIEASARKVADIIGVIDTIAFQTNILALNAAVEAARAGEQGRGFAVVASEVRSLAQRSAGAAREIKTIINASVSQVSQGTELVRQAGSTMQEIVEAIDRLHGIVAKVQEVTREQALGISQVDTTLVELDRATQQNAALVEESASAAASLDQQARSLIEQVARFRLEGGLSAR